MERVCWATGRTHVGILLKSILEVIFYQTLSASVLQLMDWGEYTLYARRRMTFRITASKGQRLEVDFLR